MTLEFTLLISQTAAVFFLACWLSTGVFENFFYADLNRRFTSEVLDFTRLREQYPEVYTRVAHRRITDAKLHKWMFGFIVGWETFAVLTLWVGVVGLLLAILGIVDSETARSLGLLGALLFTSTWAGFLIVGNWFCYWFCHEDAQNTHFQMTLWGFATMIMLVVG